MFRTKDLSKYLKKGLIKEVVELSNKVHELTKQLPGTKTDSYIQNYRNKVEPFKFTYTVPSLDWFETKNVEIAFDDYYYFELEKRFGPSWWLIGKNPYDEPNYHWKSTQIGEISSQDLKRFIEWAKSLSTRGCPITKIRVLSGDFDIFDEIKELLNIDRNK